MTTFAPNRSVLSAGIAAALLVRCGGSQPPIAAPGAMALSHDGRNVCG